MTLTQAQIGQLRKNLGQVVNSSQLILDRIGNYQRAKVGTADPDNPSRDMTVDELLIIETWVLNHISQLKTYVTNNLPG